MEAGTLICKIPSPYGRGQYKYASLKELHDNLFGGNMPVKHDALYDTEKCLECYIKIKSIGNDNKTNAQTKKVRKGEDSFSQTAPCST